jgi:Na+/H+-dicarboxylate symporter
VDTLRAHAFSLALLAAIAAGVGLGVGAPEAARAVRPVGDLFLDLVFTAVVPLVFLTVASSVARAAGTGWVSRVALATAAAFAGMGTSAAVLALAWLRIGFPALGAGVPLPGGDTQPTGSLAEVVVGALAVSDFAELLSRRNVLPLVLAAVAVGTATGRLGDAAAPVARLLDAGAAVIVRIVGWILWLAPVGLAAWFATTTADVGEHLAAAYVEVLRAYLSVAAAYYVVGFSAWAMVAGGPPAARRLWGVLLAPTLTAAGTCSSLATVPVNLEAATALGLPPTVRDVVVPLGAALHKDGSVIAAVTKIVFLHAAFGRPFGAGDAGLALAVSLACGSVVSAVPSGGLVAEALILSVYGFPPEALPAVAVISVLVDPAATVLNATGDLVAAALVARWAPDAAER